MPDEYYEVPLGEARVVRPGAAVTVVAYGTMVHVAGAAADATGIDAEILDLRTLVPFDLDTILASVEKTGRCVVVHEATRTSGFGAEVVALVQENAFYSLEVPIERRHRLRHAVPAHARVGLLPEPHACRCRTAPRDRGERRLTLLKYAATPILARNELEVQGVDAQRG